MGATSGTEDMSMWLVRMMEEACPRPPVRAPEAYRGHISKINGESVVDTPPGYRIL